MNQDSLVLVLTVFVGLVAISQIVQMVALIKIQQRAKALQDQVAHFSPRAEALLQSAQLTIDQTRQQVSEVSTRANSVLDSAISQLATVEGILGDVNSRARVQMDRMELVLDDTLGRVHETVATVHNGVMKPLREISGVSAGIRAAVAHMLKGGRPSVAQATQDEEMFI